MQNKHIKGWLTLIFAIAFIIFLAYEFRVHIDIFKSFVEENPVLGVATFLFITIVDSMLVPGISFAIIPLGSQIWGHWLTALFTIIGWLAGASFAFSLARKYGEKLVLYLVSREHLEEFKNTIPKNIFWFIIFARMVFPLDFFSYALGLFSDIKIRKYLTATFIGITPSAIVLAIIGKLPPIFEVISLIGGAVFLVWAGIYFKNKFS